MIRAIANWIAAAVGLRPRGPARVAIRVGVSYRADPDLVRATLEAAARDCPLVLESPAAVVTFDDFGASALAFTLAVSVADAARSDAAATDLRTRILKAFRSAGIEMPYAQHDIHLRDLDAVRLILTRVAEERAARSADNGREPGAARAVPAAQGTRRS